MNELDDPDKRPEPAVNSNEKISPDSGGEQVHSPAPADVSAELAEGHQPNPAEALCKDETMLQGKAEGTDTPGKGIDEESRAASARDAQEHPGKFHVEKNEAEQTVSIEGWITRCDVERTSADAKLQKESKSELIDPSGKDGGHLIAHSLGGPSVSAHGVELARDNLVPTDGRINKSYIDDVENSLRQELAAGRELYLRAEVSYRDNSALPEKVTYNWMERDGEGGLKPCSINHRGEQISSVETYLRPDTEKPGMTVANVYKSAPEPAKSLLH